MRPRAEIRDDCPLHDLLFEVIDRLDVLLARSDPAILGRPPPPPGLAYAMTEKVERVMTARKDAEAARLWSTADAPEPRIFANEQDGPAVITVKTVVPRVCDGCFISQRDEYLSTCSHGTLCPACLPCEDCS